MTDARGVRTDYLFDDGGAYTFSRTEVTPGNWIQNGVINYIGIHRPALEVDAKGNFTVYEWSGDGSRLERVGRAAVTAGQFEDPISLAEWQEDMGDVIMGNIIAELSEFDIRVADYLYHYNTINGIPNLTDVYDARGGLTQFEYNDPRFPNSPTATIDSVGNRTEIGYNNNGYLETTLAILNPQDLQSRIRTRYQNYNQFGQPEQVIFNFQNGVYDPQYPDQDLITRSLYDAVGRLVLTQDPTGRCALAAYDAAGFVTRTAQNWSQCVPGFDVTNLEPGDVENAVFALPYHLADPDPNPDQNIITSFLNDEVGRLVSVSNTLGQPTRFGYDAAGRLVITINRFVDMGGPPLDDVFDVTYNDAAPDQNIITRFSYDQVGNRTGTQIILGEDPDGNTVTRTDYVCYDGLNRPVRQILNVSVFNANLWFDNDPATNPTVNPCTFSYVFTPVGRMCSHAWFTTRPAT